MSDIICWRCAIAFLGLWYVLRSFLFCIGACSSSLWSLLYLCSSFLGFLLLQLFNLLLEALSCCCEGQMYQACTYAFLCCCKLFSLSLCFSIRHGAVLSVDVKLSTQLYDVGCSFLLVKDNIKNGAAARHASLPAESLRHGSSSNPNHIQEYGIEEPQSRSPLPSILS